MSRPCHRKHNPQWVGGPKAWRTRASRGSTVSASRGPTVVSALMILKDCYPQQRIGGGPSPRMERPPWAKWARDRHYITPEQYYAVPVELVETLVGSKRWKQEQRWKSLMPFASPFDALLKKGSP